MMGLVGSDGVVLGSFGGPYGIIGFLYCTYTIL